MAVVSFQTAVLLFAAMGAVQMATAYLLLQPKDPCIFYDDVTVDLADTRGVIHV
jgi:hypothetical protein